MVKKAEKICQGVRESVEKWREYFKYNIDQYHQMHSFVLGRQWTDDEEDAFKTFRKYPMQFNKLATLVNTLLGEQQQNTPQIEVVPLTKCDERTAEIRTALTKDIMLSSDAKLVYQVAASQAFVGGFGAYILDTEYRNNDSFDQDIVYRYFKDATRCYWDLGAEEVNKTDGMYAGYLSRMTRQKFAKTYGKHIEEKIVGDSRPGQTKEEIALVTDPSARTSDPFDWADANSVAIVDHYVRKYVTETLYKLSNGEVLNEEQFEELIDHSLKINRQMLEQEIMQQMQEQQGMMQQSPDMMQKMGQQQDAGVAENQAAQGVQGGEEQGQLSNQNQNPYEQGPVPEQEGAVDEGDLSDSQLTLYYEGEPVRIENKRTVKKSKIIHYKISGDYILEESEFPSEDLPLIFMDQNSYYQKDGKQICRPFVVDAVDAQRYLNYLGTQSAFILKMSRYDQFLVSKQHVKGLDTQNIWKDPTIIQGALIYDESPQGNIPQQLSPPELSNSLMQQYQRAIEDMYTSTGLYPTRMGQGGNEVSGAAIDARTRQGSYPTYVAYNSVNRAVTAGGRILNQMIPRVFDSTRVITLMNAEDGKKNIIINREVDEYGEIIEHDIRKGTYEVRLQAGPSYEGQKQQALESLNMVLQANPQLLNLFADLYAENLPLVNTIEIKNRLKTIVPPDVIKAGKTGQIPQQQKNPQEEAQQQALQAQVQFQQAQIQIKQQELALKAKQQQIDAQIEMQKLQAEKLEIAGKLEEQKLRYMSETQRTQSDAAISHADNLVKILTSHTYDNNKQ